MQEQEIQKSLMKTFNKIQKAPAKKANNQEQTLDPKRRAIREGLLKNMETKTLTNPESNKM